MLVACLAALGLRFVNLESDFPPGINWSADLYTDEGWYSRSAVQRHLTGEWLQEGDFNPIVNLPVFQLLQAAVFSTLGLSLASARLTVVVASIAICLLSFSLMARQSSPLAAWLTALLLACNLTLYAFSRVALLELPMTALVLLGLWLATWTRPPRWLALGLAALAFLLATLTKSTALLVLPAAVYLIWKGSPSDRQRWIASAGFLAAVGLGLAAYYLVARAWQPEVFASFLQVEFEPRLAWTPLSIVQAAARAIYRGWVLDRIAYPVTLLALPWLLLRKGERRDRRLAIAFTVWMATFLLALSVRGYHPPRYYLPISVPLAGSLAMAAVEIRTRLATTRWRAAPVLVVAAIASANLVAIGRSVAAPEYSYIRMAEDVARRIRAGSGPSSVLVGNIASSLTLATGVPSINSELGTRDLSWKFERYRPEYYIALGREVSTVRQLQQVYELEPLADYDVLGNYYSGKRVSLYRLLPKEVADR